MVPCINSHAQSAAILGIAVLVALTLLGLINRATEEPVRLAKQQWMLDNLTAVLPAGSFDQNPVLSLKKHIQPELGGAEPVGVYTAYRNKQPMAAVLELIAPDGYSGNIRLLVGIHSDGKIVAARVIEHKETPGLGDGIEYQKSLWITQFDGQSFGSSIPEDWQISKREGKFDALTGATVTSRAVAQAIYRALKWFESNRTEVFSR